MIWKKYYHFKIFILHDEMQKFVIMFVCFSLLNIFLIKNTAKDFWEKGPVLASWGAHEVGDG